MTSRQLSRRCPRWKTLCVLLVCWGVSGGGIAVSARGAEKFPLPPARAGNGRLTSLNGIPLMVLQGTPEEIGRQHGRLMGQHVKPLLNYPRLFLKRIGQEKQWPLVATAGKFLLQRVPAAHRREIQAAIRASGQNAEAIVVANTMLELRRLGGCSALIVERERSKTGEILFGRNFDFPPLGLLDKYGLVILCRPKNKLAFAAVGYPGLFGVVSGMNEAGLCVATLDVYSSRDGSPKFDPAGTPMMFTFRRLLEECRTVAQAEQLLRRCKATTWMNLAVCDRKGAAVFELTPRSVVMRPPDKGLLPCTNHFRTPSLCTSKECRRYQRLCRSQQLPKLGRSDVLKLLNEANQGGWTIQTMLFEPATLTLHVSLRNPPTSARPWIKLPLKNLLHSPGRQPDKKRPTRNN